MRNLNQIGYFCPGKTTVTEAAMLVANNTPIIVLAATEKQAFAQQEKSLSVFDYLPPIEITGTKHIRLPPTRKERRKAERNAKKFKKI